MDRRLREVAEHGQPAHAAEAVRLLDLLAADPDDAVALDAADALVAAYLHDPYLTR